jgi:signal transduction histidine kinase
MRRALSRIVLLSSAVVAVLLVVAVTVMDWWDAEARTSAEGEQQVTAVAEVMAVSADRDVLRRAVARTAAGERGDLAVHLAERGTVGASHANPGDVALAMRHGDTFDAEVDGGTVHLHPVTMVDGGTGVVEVYLPDGDLAGTLLPRLAVLVLVAVGSVLVAGLVGRLRTRSIVSALRMHAVSAAGIGGERKGTRLHIEGPEELSALATSLNRIADRIEELLATERELVADLSHRLRTPLTALRLDSESIGDGPVADRVRHAVSALGADIDELIRTAGSNARAASTTCDAAAVVRDRMTFWSTLAEHQNRSCELRCEPDTALVPLPQQDVAAVVDALAGNVFQHTPSAVPFAVTLVRHRGWVTLVVEDGGPGIADPEAALRRGASSQGSTGLGLDIARHAVEATGGTIYVDRGRLQGARIRLRFGEAGAHHSRSEPRAWRLWSGRTSSSRPASDAEATDPRSPSAG